MKKTRQTKKLYLLQQELNSLKDEMGEAMQNAFIPYVAEGKSTVHMEFVLTKFYYWAKRYTEEVRK